MGKWKCNNCETINDGDIHICEVCEASAPYISKFECDSSDISEPLLCNWIAENTNRLFIQLNDEKPIETTDNKYFFDIKKNSIVRFILENEITKITYEYPILLSVPRIDYFKVDKSCLYLGEKFKVYWQVSNAETIFLNDKTISKKGELILDSDLNLNLKALNSAGSIQEKISLKVYPLPKIKFSVDRNKIKVDDSDGILLKWDITNAEKAILRYDENEEISEKKSEKKLYPKKTNIYQIDVIGLDGKRHFLKEVKVEVFPEATIKFEVDKEYVFPNIPFTLKWETENAKKVTLNGDVVENCDLKLIEGVEKETTYQLFVTDEFGVKEKNLTVKMLPLPRIESLVVPMPDIQKNINLRVNISVPNISVESLVRDFKEYKIENIINLDNAVQKVNEISFCENENKIDWWKILKIKCHNLFKMK